MVRACKRMADPAHYPFAAPPVPLRMRVGGFAGAAVDTSRLELAGRRQQGVAQTGNGCPVGVRDSSHRYLAGRKARLRAAQQPPKW